MKPMLHARLGELFVSILGSDYSEGVLHGVLATLHKGKLRGYQMVSG